MKISIDISMYPLDADYKPAIKAFIRKLGTYDGLTIVTNQMSTQINGEYEAVTSALNQCMAETMASPAKVVFVARYLNADLDIECLPHID